MLFFTTLLLPFLGKIIAAFIGGLIPVLIWLWIFEHEDKHPEPHKLVLAGFVGGMIGVIAVIPLEEAVAYFFPITAQDGIITFAVSTVACFLLWGAIEETMKFAAAHFTVLERAENDEPVDSMMYMIITALGFASLENALFIIRPILEGDFAQAFATGSVRFVQATLIHVVCSSIIGFALSISFYKSKNAKRLYAAIGLILAIALHTFFNLSIILSTNNTAFALYAVWFGLIIVFIFFHKVKRITKPL